MRVLAWKCLFPQDLRQKKHMGDTLVVSLLRATPSAGSWLLLLLELQIHLNTPRHRVSRKQKTEECLNKLMQNPVICTVSEDYVYAIKKKKKKQLLRCYPRNKTFYKKQDKCSWRTREMSGSHLTFPFYTLPKVFNCFLTASRGYASTF